jgi:hypothetical protein
VPGDGGLAAGGLKAVSFSRDSDGKEQRLREWAERKQLGHHDREHRRNRWTAAKHEPTVAGEVNSIESAADTGTRGDEIIAVARATGATAVIVPSLRRLGVGLAQVQLRQQLEQAGLTIISEKDSENRFLQCEDDARRELELWRIAGEDAYEWRRNKERLAQAHVDHWQTEDGQATLQFIADRPHLSLPKLAAALELYDYRTAQGSSRWYPQTVKRARARVHAVAALTRTMRA